jgi:hypothetical protein
MTLALSLPKFLRELERILRLDYNWEQDKINSFLLKAIMRSDQYEDMVVKE